MKLIDETYKVRYNNIEIAVDDDKKEVIVRPWESKTNKFPEDFQPDPEANVFHETFSNDNQSKDAIALMQYENLRKYFKLMTDIILGDDYYNMGMDVYTTDELTCRDIVAKFGNKYKKRWDILAIKANLNERGNFK